MLPATPSTKQRASLARQEVPTLPIQKKTSWPESWLKNIYRTLPPLGVVGRAMPKYTNHASRQQKGLLLAIPDNELAKSLAKYPKTTEAAEATGCYIVDSLQRSVLHPRTHASRFSRYFDLKHLKEESIKRMPH